MEQHFSIRFPVDRSSERLDLFLSECFPELSRSQLKRLIDTGQVLMAGVSAKAGSKLKGGELVEVTLPEAEPVEALPENLPLSIIHEDSNLIVIDKAVGMVVHPAAGHASGTLVNALLYHCDDLAGIGGELRPGIVHRLDKDTSGVMVATKNEQSHLHLAEQFRLHTVKRRYLALVHGKLPGRRGTIDAPIGRHPTQRKKMSSRSRQGKEAITHWKLLRDYADDRLSLVELSLETGRTHQIRVHLSEQNHPLVGDPVYGSKQRCRSLSDPQLKQLVAEMPGQALHARLLGFIHPASGEYLEFSSQPYGKMREILDYLDQKYAGLN